MDWMDHCVGYVQSTFRMKGRFKCGHQPCLSREERRKAKGIKTVLVLWPSLDDDAIGALDPMLLTIPPFALLAISNGDILCFVKIPSFDGDIFSFAHSFPDMGRSHTTTEDFFSIEIFICTPGHSSAVFLLCGWWWSICTVYWIEIFICWEFYSPLSGVVGSLHGHGSQGVVRLFHTDCTISYHFLHHFVPFFAP